jgi:hypothetical protein
MAGAFDQAHDVAYYHILSHFDTFITRCWAYSAHSTRAQCFVGFVTTSRYVQRFNLKTWSLDATCIHGVASRRAGHVTVFPHAIAQGATFDVDLVRAMSNITAVEARIVSAQSYFSGGGESALVHASLPSAYRIFLGVVSQPLYMHPPLPSAYQATLRVPACGVRYTL